MSDEKNFEDDFDDLNADLDDDLIDDLDSAEGDDWDDDFDDWDENSDSAESTTQLTPKKKKGGFGKLLFILVVLGGAGGAVYFTVLGGKMPGSNGQGQATQQQNIAANGQENGQDSTLASMPAPDMPDVNSASSAPMDMGEMPPMPTAMVMDDDSAPRNTVDTPAIEFPKMDMGGSAQGGLTPMPDFSAPTPSVPDFAQATLPTPDIPAPAIQAPPMPVPEPTMQEPAMSMPDPAPVMAMPDFDGAAPISAPDLPSMDVPAPVIKSAPAPMPTPVIAAPAVDTKAFIGKLDSVEEQMDEILSRMERLEKDLAKMRRDGDDVSQLSAELGAIKKRLNTASNSATSTASKKVTRTAPAIPSTRSVSKPVKSKPKAPAQWVLKGIAQNEAWIAQKGSTDIKKVSVGDAVSGLGRINSIGLENGVWIVRGTQGSVKQ